MRLGIAGLAELRARLAAVKPQELMSRALSEQASRMAAAVQESLSQPPGSGEHDKPWLQSGSLRDSVGSITDGLEAAVGSSDPAAAPQELGTVRMAPRPFLAPVAARMGEDVARYIGATVAAAMRGEPADEAVTDRATGGADASASGSSLAGKPSR